MLKWPLVLVFVIASLAVTIPTMSASSAPCIPDCPQSQYNGPYKIILQIGPSCFVQVTYWRRLACGVDQDVAITEVRILSTATCNFYNTSAFLETLTRELLKKTSGTLKQDSCVTQWRVTRASCWRSDTTNACGDTLMVPCQGVGCCLIRYQICGDSTQLGGKRVRPTDILTTGTCLDTAQWSPCRNACDTSLTGAQGLRTTSVNDPLLPNSLRISPNPAEQSIRIGANPMQFNEFDYVSFSDLQGRRILEVRIGKAERETGFIDVDVSMLKSGMYVVACSGPQVLLSTQLSILR